MGRAQEAVAACKQPTPPGCPDGKADPLTHHFSSLCWDGCLDRFRELASREELLVSFGKGCPQLPPHHKLRHTSGVSEGVSAVVYR